MFVNLSSRQLSNGRPRTKSFDNTSSLCKFTRLFHCFPSLSTRCSKVFPSPSISYKSVIACKLGVADDQAYLQSTIAKMRKFTYFAFITTIAGVGRFTTLKERSKTKFVLSVTNPFDYTRSDLSKYVPRSSVCSLTVC